MPHENEERSDDDDEEADYDGEDNYDDPTTDTFI